MAKALRRTAAFTALWRSLTSGSRGGAPLGKRLAALPRMIRATSRGQYDGGLRLAMMAAATAYVVSPIDFVPEGILFLLGIGDDIIAATWLAGALLAETDRFLEWERQRARVVPGQVVPRGGAAAPPVGAEGRAGTAPRQAVSRKDPRRRTSAG
jgi:uncharacterized membrane protein YkvA (DUF1232 family)